MNCANAAKMVRAVLDVSKLNQTRNVFATALKWTPFPEILTVVRSLPSAKSSEAAVSCKGVKPCKAVLTRGRASV